MKFDREAAKQAGYSDQEIDEFISRMTDQSETKTQPSFNREAARAQGYTDEEIDQYLKQRGQDTGVNLAPQAVMAAKEFGPAIPQAAIGAGQVMKQAAQAVGNLPVYRTAADVAGMATHGVPWGSVAAAAREAADVKTLRDVYKTAVDVAKATPGAIASGARNIGGAVVRGAMAPESLMLAPYQMAAAEQEKIRANPNAPELKYNPLAMALRGEAPTQGSAGQMNIRRTIAERATAYTPTAEEARNLLASNDQRQINLYGGRNRLQQLANPNAFNSGFAQQLNMMSK